LETYLLLINPPRTLDVILTKIDESTKGFVGLGDNFFISVMFYSTGQGAQKLTGDNLKVIWAKFSTLS
jgi:hypothetical protein